MSDSTLDQLRDGLYEKARAYYRDSKDQADKDCPAHASLYAEVNRHLEDAANSVDAALLVLKEADE